MNTSTNDKETVVIYYSICLAMCYVDFCPIVYTADGVKDYTIHYINEDGDEVLSTDRLLVVGRKFDKKFIEFVIANNGKRLEHRIEEQWEMDHGYDPIYESVELISYRPVFKDGIFVDWEKDLNNDGEYNKEPGIEIGEHPSDTIRCQFTYSTIDECKCITCITIRTVNNNVK